MDGSGDLMRRMLLDKEYGAAAKTYYYYYYYLCETAWYKREIGTRSYRLSDFHERSEGNRVDWLDS